jgi:hypothetical protein
MIYLFDIPLLPLWIMGAPLIAAVVSLATLPRAESHRSRAPLAGGGLRSRQA